MVLCGDLVCENGGECLDDFICLCPADYTGSQCETRISTYIVINFEFVVSKDQQLIAVIIV